MPGLPDIAPRTEAVEIAGAAFTLRGLTANFIASMLDRFPDLRRAMSSAGEVDVAALMASCGAAIPDVIAAGLGRAGDAEAIEWAGALDLDVQVEFLPVILRLTAPAGIGPLVDKLGLGGDGPSSSAPASK